MKPAGQAAKDAVNKAGEKIPEPGQAESTTKVCNNHAHEQLAGAIPWPHIWILGEFEDILKLAL